MNSPRESNRVSSKEKQPIGQELTTPTPNPCSVPRPPPPYSHPARDPLAPTSVRVPEVLGPTSDHLHGKERESILNRPPLVLDIRSPLELVFPRGDVPPGSSSR